MRYRYDIKSKQKVITMKQYLLQRLLVSILFLTVSTLSWAYDFVLDGIYYNINSDKTSVTVTYKTKYYNSYSGSIIIPSKVTYSSKTYEVTSIGEYAFYGCSELTSITIPNSVTSVGQSTFDSCNALEYVTIGNGVTGIEEETFENCYSLKSITIGNSVKFIGKECFKNCRSLTSIILPNSVTSIGRFAFSGCSGLTSVTIPNSVTSIGEGAFAYCSGLTSLKVEEGNPKYDCRNNCNAIIESSTNTLIVGCKTTTIPNSVTSIESSAFYGCSELTSVTIPNSVTSIGKEAFRGCSGLTSVTIPNSVTSIGEMTFNDCSGLISVTIGKSVTSIGEGAFAYCSGLTSASIPNSVTSIGSSAFYGCSGLTSVTIGNSVTSIGNYAFSGCSGLTSVTIPNSVTSIGRSAFEDCRDLTSVTIPNSVTSIGGYAFYGCSDLTSVTIGNSVTSIESSAFGGCSSLTSVTCLAEQVPSTGPNVFQSGTIASATLYVPETSLDTYESTTPWKNFGTILHVAEPTYIVGDANGNGEVEIGDVTSVLTLMATPEAIGYDKKAADANGNGEIEIGDVTTILTIMANGGYSEEWNLTVRDQDNNYVVPAEGGTKTVVLTTTRDVELSCSESWAHLGTMSYNVLENGKIYELYPEITFDANTTGEVRAATIYFDNGTDNRLSLIYTQERVRYDVVPPTWKGFDYKVKKGGVGEDTERGEIGPGDKVRVYCVRKSNGVLTGMIKGTITLKWTTQASGPSVVTEMTESVTTPVNPTYDGWLLYSYADFNIPDGGPYDFCKAEVTCNLNFECFGNAVRWEDHTSHMDPYIGSIYTTNCNATKGSACTTENVLLWKSN